MCIRDRSPPADFLKAKKAIPAAALTFSTKDGVVVAVPDATADAVRSHQPPPGYVLKAVNESSFTGQWDAYCERAGAKHDALLYCKFDVECRNK